MGTGDYSLEMTYGSRIDEFCFYCAGLSFDKNQKFRCTPQKWSGSPVRFKNPRIDEVTIRPEGSASGIASNCYKREAIASITELSRMPQLLDRIKGNVENQVREHEKVAAPLELYRLEFNHSGPVKGALYQIFGVVAKPMPVTQESLSKKNNPLVLIDGPSKMIWIRAPKHMLEGLAVGVGKVSGQLDFAYSATFLRDLLKRDIGAFNVEVFNAGEEPDSFKGRFT